jgi:hypothetical protein
VTACKPEWFIHSVSGQNLHPPDAPITIVLPKSMAGAYTALDAAKTDWANDLSRDISIVDETVGCTSGACVYVNALYTGSACGGFQGGTSNSNGEYTSPSEIQLLSGWQTASESRSRRRFAHELGHFFGLRNQTQGCDPENGLMTGSSEEGQCVSSDPLPPEYALGPTPGDLAALKASPYGDLNRKRCGW